MKPSTGTAVRHRRNAVRNQSEHCPPSIGTGVRSHRNPQSFLASVSFPAWVLGHQPTKQILTLSYGQDLSDKLARDCRALMMSALYRALFNTRLSDDRN